MQKVIHEADQHRFVLRHGGAEVVVHYRPVDETAVDFISTYTPPELRGRGLARRVVEAGLAWAAAGGLRVIPTCSYVARVMAEGRGGAG